MAVRDVVLLGDEKLRRESKQVADISSTEVKQVKEDLKDTLLHLKDYYNLGRALAASQIGYLKRIIYFHYSGNSFYMVNPQITWKSEEDFEVWDSCFSFEVAFFVRIPRKKEIKLEYLTGEGQEEKQRVENDQSELFQHEIDHLNGVLAVDHLQSSRNIIMREEWEKKYQ